MVAGGWNPSLDTTEYIDLSQDDPVWNTGPQLPAKMDDFVLTNTNLGVLLIGGFDATNIQYSQAIYRLDCSFGCTWQESGHTLAAKQSSPIVIPIPDSLDLCQHAITTTTATTQSTSSTTVSTTLATNQNVTPMPIDDCSYCPECAVHQSEHIGGAASMATIDKVCNPIFIWLFRS